MTAKTTGTATPNKDGLVDASAPISRPTIPPVVGINLGNSYASIAVFTKVEGLAECIANEDGERQIACAVAFQGEEIYIGNQAKAQLVKNASNTIMGFRNLLGLKFSEIDHTQTYSSAPVIQHPTIPDMPAYMVQILQPPPAPLPANAMPFFPSNQNTPAVSHAPTPRSEPTPETRILTVSDVTTLLLRSLVQSAEDFLGTRIHGAVLTVPAWFGPTQREALEHAARDAGVVVLQLLEEAAAAVSTTTTAIWGGETLPGDRTQLVVDAGASSLALTLLSMREGLAYVLASSLVPGVGGDQIDDKLVKFFATDFTKKTKVPLSVCPPASPADARAEAKLRLAIEHTKRTVSASPGAASCSVESLKDGIDYTGSINRMRFDMVASTVYAAAAQAVATLLTDAAIDAHDVNEIVYVGGTASLPGLDERISLEEFNEDVATPFARGTVVGGGAGDPTTILARGCAFQAALLAKLTSDGEDAELVEAFKHGAQASACVATTRTMGILIPGKEGTGSYGMGGIWIPVVWKETALPVRRSVSFDVGLAEESKQMALEIWEVKEGIKVEKSMPSNSSPDDEDEQGSITVKHRTFSKESYLGCLQLAARHGSKRKGQGKDAEKWVASIEVQFTLSIDGVLDVIVKEVGQDEAVGTLTVLAA